MRKGLLRAVALSVAILALACSGQDGGDKKPAAKDSHDFRQARWGMSQEEVKASEKTSPTDERPEVITYLDDFEGMQALIGYVFEDGKLVNGGYVFMEPQEELTNYIRDYKNLKKSLVGEYGKPYLDKAVWGIGEVPEQDPEKIAEAVCSGRLRYVTMWETDATLIKLTLDRRKNRCQVALMYESIEKMKVRQTDKSKEPTEPSAP